MTNESRARDDLNASIRRLREQIRSLSQSPPSNLTSGERRITGREDLEGSAYVSPSTSEQRAEQASVHPARLSPRVGLMSSVSRGAKERVDGFAYGVLVPLIIIISCLIAEAHGWAIGGFCCLLMLVVLELSFRLSEREPNRK